MVSATLRCRGSPRKRGRSSTSMLASSRPTISAMVIVRARAAAISMASGRPSSGGTAPPRRAGRPGRRRPPHPGSAGGTVAPTGTTRDRVGTGTGERREGSTDSPGISRGERLVARIVGCWQAPRICTSQCAAASSRCSQLSTTRSTGRSAGELSSASKESKPSCGARAPGTPASSDASEVDVPGAHREHRRGREGTGAGEGGLADPTRSDDGHEPIGPKLVVELVQLTVPSDERARRHHAMV